MAASMPPVNPRNPSAVFSPVRNGSSCASIPLVSNRALLASVRAISTVGTPITSAARRAANNF